MNFIAGRSKVSRRQTSVRSGEIAKSLSFVDQEQAKEKTGLQRSEERSAKHSGGMRPTIFRFELSSFTERRTEEMLTGRDIAKSTTTLISDTFDIGDWTNGFIYTLAEVAASGSLSFPLAIRSLHFLVTKPRHLLWIASANANRFISSSLALRDDCFLLEKTNFDSEASAGADADADIAIDALKSLGLLDDIGVKSEDVAAADNDDAISGGRAD